MNLQKNLVYFYIILTIITIISGYFFFKHNNSENFTSTTEKSDKEELVIFKYMNNFLFRTKIRLHENNFNFKKLQNCNIKDNKKRKKH